ncbi:hypothetical protein J7E97_31965 [Streptomyces sp. ISL-66]|uniref:hypothetical protein n=1 Tax=Streptomyces sp. ISL-66 TaxID=2819186 RepID=UPI001BEBFC40|nr:hypothetical protein [Streptomyces sp. ISL-66]MBT2472342.1 hypothetical protein [Streptomyces sp. ISL-66]
MRKWTAELREADARADAEAEALFEVRPPLGTPPEVYWMAVEAVCQGWIAYGPAIAVHVSEG